MPTEKKQGVGNEEIHLVFLLDYCSKGINAVPHVGVTANDIDSGKSTGISILKHGAPP